jgi:hypothetical protein
MSAFSQLRLFMSSAPVSVQSGMSTPSLSFATNSAVMVDPWCALNQVLSSVMDWFTKAVYRPLGTEKESPVLTTVSFQLPEPMSMSATSAGVVALAGETAKPVTIRAAAAMTALIFFNMTDSFALVEAT